MIVEGRIESTQAATISKYLLDKGMYFVYGIGLPIYVTATNWVCIDLFVKS